MYEDLMKELSILPGELAEVLAELARTKTGIRECRIDMANREAEKLLDGVPGKNAEERKAALRVALNRDATYMDIAKSLRDFEAENDRLSARSDVLHKAISAVSAQASLLSAHMRSQVAAADAQAELAGLA